MRKTNTIKNSLLGSITYIVSTILKFTERTVFIRYIGVDYLGLNGLFSSILSLFAISELGFLTAFGVILYRYLAEKDYDKINAVVAIARKVFTVVGCIIFAASLISLSFIQFTVTDAVVPISEIRYLFILYSMSSVVTYFNYHKILLLVSDQKEYVQKRIHIVVMFFTTIAFIVLAIFTRNYAFCIIAMLVGNIAHNVWVSLKSTKMYPFLNLKNAPKIDSENMKQVKKTIVLTAGHRIGNTLVSVTDTILISALISVSILGLYSNYSLIVTTLSSIVGLFLIGIRPSVGNLWQENGSPQKAHNLFKKYYLFSFWLYSFAIIGSFIMVNPFIVLWLGKEYLLDNFTLITLCLSVFLTGLRNPVLVFKESKGLFYPDRFKPIFEVALKIVASIGFLYLFGLSGLFLGTIAVNIFVSFWVEALVLYKYGFKISVKPFLLRYVLMFLLFIVTAGVTCVATMFIGDGIWNFIWKLLICLVLPNFVYFLVFFRTDEFNYFVEFIKNQFRRKKALITGVTGQENEITPNAVCRGNIHEGAKLLTNGEADSKTGNKATEEEERIDK